MPDSAIVQSETTIDDLDALKAELAAMPETLPSPVVQPASLGAGPAGDDDDGPVMKPEPGVHPFMLINMHTPAKNTPFSGPLSQGVTITARGTVSQLDYAVKRVDVKFGGSSSVPAQLKPSADGENWEWKASSKITTAGPLEIVAVATGRRAGTSYDVPRTASATVTVKFTDETPPTLTIDEPPNNFLTTNVNSEGKFSVPLKVTAGDNLGKVWVWYGINGKNWTPIGEMSSATKWETTAYLPFSKGSQTISVQAIDEQGNVSAVSERFGTTVDTSPPTLKIKTPSDKEIKLPGNGNAGAVLHLLSGTAKDKQSGVQRVEWALNPHPNPPPTLFKLANKGGNTWATWSVENIAIPGTPSLNRIVVRCFDNANKSSETEIKVEVTERYPPKDATVQEYFRSLVDFFVRRFRTGPNTYLTVNNLTEALYQPFERLLAADATVANQPVRQLRICIEVMRKLFDYLASHTLGYQVTIANAHRQLAEGNYRQRAYEALLRRLGTSLGELGAAQSADFPTRRALANRLGFDLQARSVGPSGPQDTLQQFLLQQGQFTEADLERLFGLVDFNRDPLEKRSVDPVLLDLQLEHLEAVWNEQDETIFGAIIDPDVISEADLRSGPNPALELLQSRRIWLDSLLDALRQPPSTKMDPLTRFDQTVGAMLGPIRDLQVLEAKQQAGSEIDADVARMQLTLPAFDHLMSLRKLAAAGTIVESDWEDVYAILIQVQKLRSFADWREEEQSAGLVLSAGFFLVGTPELAGPAPSPWRLVPRGRERWRNTLQGRIEQQLAVRQALLSAVDAAEEEALPGLRTGLISALAKLKSLPAGADTLTQWLQIDVNTSGFPKVTRVEQAIQSLQRLLIVLRNGNFSGWSRDTGGETQEDFDEELRWIGAYTSWYSAMQAFLFPENFLLPTLRPAEEWSPDKFRPFIRNLRLEQRLTPEKARQLADEHFSITLSTTPKGLGALRGTTKGTINSALATLNPPMNSKPPIEKLKAITTTLKEKYYFAPLALAFELQKSGQYLAALDWFRMVYAYDLPLDQRKIYYGLELERDTQPDRTLVFQRAILWLAKTLNPHDIVDESYADPPAARYDVHTRFVVTSIVKCLLDFADAEYTQDTNESLPRADALYMQALSLLSTPELNPKPVPELSPNSVVARLRLRAQVALAKLRSGRNIAGMKRQIEAVAPLGQTVGSMPLIVSSSPFGSSSPRAMQPTPYRYTALIDRAKQLVTIAQQVEQTYLSALEKRDAEAYSLFKAKQDLALSHLNVQLQDLRVIEAADGVTLAQKQQERAAFQVQAYQGLLDTGMNVWERRLLDDYKDARDARNWKIKLDAAVEAAKVITDAASGGILGTGIGAGLGTAAGAAALMLIQSGHAIELNNIEARTQEHTLLASVENRKQDWALQQGVAQKDVIIGAQQSKLAQDHLDIVELEGFISQMQFANAQATVEFLAGKFTNVELYEWMIGVLQEVYSYFLQQATAMAQLAQNQLAFERQEATPLFIQKDYWQPSADVSAFGGSSDDPDRRGLTGSARLLQNVYQLDQFAFETNKRKLNLTKTISLARLAPLEFQNFRKTGVMTFATPMQLFDQDFPGHYLRLVKRIRTSVVALTPPHEGIRATLSTAGVSRVVIGGDSFQPVPLRRDPESVALTSPGNATGVFELAAQPELLLPFENMGVDALWNLEMPKAANPFDYRTIADVLITIEYTALSSPDYRQQVTQRLDRTVSADRPYSFRNQFADQWYDLHNPGQTARPMAVSFTTTREDFPPNVEDLTTGQVALYFVLADGKTVKDFRAQLRFTEQGAQTPIGGEATATPDGIISTRLGNASSWMPMINRSPFGKWELALPDTAEVRNLFTSEAISDIVFVITCSGRSPDWPA